MKAIFEKVLGIFLWFALMAVVIGGCIGLLKVQQIFTDKPVTQTQGENYDLEGTRPAS